MIQGSQWIAWILTLQESIWSGPGASQGQVFGRSLWDFESTVRLWIPALTWTSLRFLISMFLIWNCRICLLQGLHWGRLFVLWKRLRASMWFHASASVKVKRKRKGKARSKNELSGCLMSGRWWDWSFQEFVIDPIGASTFWCLHISSSCSFCTLFLYDYTRIEYHCAHFVRTCSLIVDWYTGRSRFRDKRVPALGCQMLSIAWCFRLGQGVEESRWTWESLLTIPGNKDHGMKHRAPKRKCHSIRWTRRGLDSRSTAPCI